MEQDTNGISKYDRLYGASKQVGLSTKQSTIASVEEITGRSETFIVQTFRHEEGDRIFIQQIDENRQVVRMALPTKVCNAIASQRASLSAKRRRIASKVVAQARKDRGELPGFMKRK